MGCPDPVLMGGCKWNNAKSCQPLIHISFPKIVGEGVGEGGGMAWGGNTIFPSLSFCQSYLVKFSIIFS